MHTHTQQQMYLPQTWIIKQDHLKKKEVLSLYKTEQVESLKLWTQITWNSLFGIFFVVVFSLSHWMNMAF